MLSEHKTTQLSIFGIRKKKKIFYGQPTKPGTHYLLGSWPSLIQSWATSKFFLCQWLTLNQLLLLPYHLETQIYNEWLGCGTFYTLDRVERYSKALFSQKPKESGQLTKVLGFLSLLGMLGLKDNMYLPRICVPQVGVQLIPLKRAKCLDNFSTNLHAQISCSCFRVWNILYSSQKKSQTNSSSPIS